MEAKPVVFLAVRYLVLIVLGLFNLGLFYLVFTPLTVFPVYWISYLLSASTTLLEGNIIFFMGYYAEIIPACVAGAAYYLLLILNLSTPMEWKKRVYSISFALSAFWVLNVIRILIFMQFLVLGQEYFDVAHRLTWYFGSTLMVVIIWFAGVWIFKIKNIPVYTDVKNIFSDVFGNRGVKNAS